MIDILMATYNGEKYLAEQIESIINQSYTNWHLYIQDDCSTDRTLTVAFSYQKKFPEKITVIKNTKNSGSAKDNFFSMLSLSTSEYIMFSDQDDIWLPDKIKITHNRMLRLEKKYGKKFGMMVSRMEEVSVFISEMLLKFFFLVFVERKTAHWILLVLK